MAEYLTKEEIKQWRSSLEKITLEEFAARLGKQIEEAKKTNDLVDIVLKGKSYTSSSDISITRTEKITSIAERAISKERQITSSKDISNIIETQKATIKPIVTETNEKPKTQKTAKQTVTKTKKENQKPIIENITENTTSDELQIVFKKALTDREQLVFDYFLKNKNQIVYAKDLANLLSLPRDYVYKYIKNLRAKIDGERLKNAEAGGFMLTI